MKTGKTNSHVQTVEIKGEKFELELPKELQIKPMFEFNVSRNCKMLVYADKQDKTVWIEGQQKTISVDCYAYTVINAEGAVVRKAIDPYQCRGDNDKLGIVDDLLDLMFAAKSVARRLVVKKKTTKVIEEDEDEY